MATLPSASNGLNLDEQGEWFEDADPIITLRFIEYGGDNHISRWLLVQKESSTTICEPEFRRIGSYDRAPNQAYPPKSHQIFANPICTVPRGMTGGSAQCDVSFQRSSSGFEVIATSTCYH